MTYVFLYLNLFLLLIPFVFLLDKKFLNVNQIKSAIVPSLSVAIIFSEIAVFFTAQKIWIFDSQYLLGIFYRGIPLEQYVFVFTFNFAGLGIYNYLNTKFPNNELQKYSLLLSNLLLGIFIAILYFAYPALYPLLTASIFFLLLIFVEYGSHLRFMYKFYRAFIVTLIPFYICYGVICNLPIISYQSKGITGFKIWNIPFENHLYIIAMLLLNVFLSEYLRRKAQR